MASKGNTSQSLSEAKAAKKDSAAKTYVEQPSYTALEARQGRADAEMLMEKQ